MRVADACCRYMCTPPNPVLSNLAGHQHTLTTSQNAKLLDVSFSKDTPFDAKPNHPRHHHRRDTNKLVLFDASILYRKESIYYDEAGVEGLWVLESDCVLCEMVQRGTFRTSQKSLLCC